MISNSGNDVINVFEEGVYVKDAILTSDTLDTSIALDANARSFDPTKHYISFELANLKLGSIYPNGGTQFGNQNVADGTHSFSTGIQTRASGESSVAHGTYSIAKGKNSSASGFGCLSIGTNSHTSGLHNTASGVGSHCLGARASDNKHDYSFVWGDGTWETIPNDDHQFTIRASNGLRIITKGNAEVSTIDGEWSYETKVADCWGKSTPKTLSEAIDRLARAYARQKGAIP